MSSSTRAELSRILLMFIGILTTVSGWAVVDKFSRINERLSKEEEFRMALDEKLDSIIYNQGQIVVEISNLKEKEPQ